MVLMLILQISNKHPPIWEGVLYYEQMLTLMSEIMLSLMCCVAIPVTLYEQTTKSRIFVDIT